ncbi:MAG: 2-phospho-L-lactate guanylyltransferase [Sphingomonadaceae bacterium]
MTWTAVVPIKTVGERKSRLAAQLSVYDRAAISERMFHHVVDVLKRHSGIKRIIVLSKERPRNWEGEWVADADSGLNAELESARAAVGGDVVVLHADLPLLTAEDVSALLEAAEEHVIAIAPDRHGTGTNGLAVKAGTAIEYRFGPDSFRRHHEQAPIGAVVRLNGFGFDLDTPEDLSLLMASGWRTE